MRLNEIGEFGFIDRFTPWFNDLIQNHQVGIGDDCAIIPATPEEDWLITTDLLIEEVHFLREAISPELLGYKSLAVNLSDIAAMGGLPTGSFLSLAIPDDIDVEYLDAFMKGYHELSMKYRVPLLGGDTTKSLKHFVINVCVTGKCPVGKAKKRNMAQTGDVVCVTGNLGDSAAGLKFLLNKQNTVSSSASNFLIEKHRKPEPRIKEGLFFSSLPDIHAMIDISDGIASDLYHILETSHKQAIIDINKLPLSNQLLQITEDLKCDPIELAVAGGEDYELLLTVAANSFSEIETEYQNQFGKPLYSIGLIQEGTPHLQWMKGGIEYQISKTGFNHFSS